MRKIISGSLIALALMAQAEDLEWKCDPAKRNSEVRYASYLIAPEPTSPATLSSGIVFDSYWHFELSSVFLRLITNPASGILLFVR